MDGQVKIGDFGMARAFGDEEDLESLENLSNKAIGSRHYKAPELILGDRKYGPSVDVWSVACIVAELFFK